MRPALHRTLIPCVLTLLGVAACKDGGNAEHSDPLAEEELPEECAPDKEDKLRQKIVTAVSRIRVGRQHADLNLMDTNERTLTNLQKCGDAFHRFCDAECSVQRASVYLFRAAALPVLASKKFSTAEEAMLQATADGLAIVARALDRLPRQKGFSAGANADDKEGKGGYNGYLRAHAALQAMQAELQMTAGDIWYRRVSSTRSTAVGAFVNDVLADTASSAKKEDTDLATASFYYEQAYWTLLDARTSLPSGSDTNTAFAGELNKVHALTQQVGERMRSLREGKLYIGIDPNGLQDGSRASARSLSELFGQLNLQRRQLELVEGQVEGTMEKWGQQAQELAGIGDQVAELQNSRKIDLEVHKIQQLHEKTEALTKPLLADIEDARAAGDRFELEGRITGIKLELDNQTAKFRNDIAVLESQREVDILDREIEGLRLDLDEVNSAIESTMAHFNFLMQQRALEQRLQELGHSRGQEIENLAALDAQIAQADAEIQRLQQEIARLELEITQTRTRQSEVIDRQVVSLDRQIEAMQADLTFYTASKQLEICAAREAIERMNATDLTALVNCLTAGGTCQFAAIHKQILDAKSRQAAAIRTEVSATKTLLNQRINDTKVAVAAWGAANLARSGAVAAAAAAGTVAALVPSVTVGVQGIFPVAVTTINPYQAAQAAFEGVKELTAIASEGIQYGHQLKDLVTQTQIALANAERELATANENDLIAAYEQQQALAELNTRLLDATAQKNLAENRLKAQQIECVEAGGQRTANIDRTAAQLASLQAQRSAQGGERKILDVEVKQLQNLIQQSQASIRKFEAQKNEIAVRKRQADSSVKHYEELTRAVNTQLGEVKQYDGKLTTLEQRQTELRQVLREHVQKVSLVRSKANATQQKFVLDAIERAQTIAFDSLDTLRRQLEALDKARALTADVRAIEAQARTTLEKHRNELVSLVENRPLPTVATVIWDFEDLSARLTRGAGELLDYKRGLLASTNFYYNAYRYRYNMLSDFVGKGRVEDGQPLVWTTDDLTTKVADCGDLNAAAMCNVSSLANESTSLKLGSATFVISRSSPLFQELLSYHRVRFEFSSSARSLEESHALGDYALWDGRSMGDDEELRVVTFFLGFPDLRCHPTKLEIAHTGVGYQRDASRTARMVALPPVSERPTIVSLDSVGPSGPTVVEERIRSMVGELTERSLTVTQLDQRFEGGAQGTMAFVGYPLRGQFELVNVNDKTRCLEGAQDMRLTVVFARR